MSVLVTGGAGYIGTHTCIELVKAGYNIVVLDNLCNSKKEAITRLEEIIQQKVPFIEGDIRDKALLTRIFQECDIKAVIHFAGLKAVGESCEIPLEYFQNNVAGTLTLCETMAENGIFNILFSSSATVYGVPKTVPILEDFPTSAENPYGRSKLMVEEMLKDACKAKDSQWKVSLLRYFNPIGAHESGTIGEDPKGIPNNLLPFVAQVAVGKLEKLRVFGDDYPTPDGTGVRDYIHVVDLAVGHVKALAKLLESDTGCYTYNLGTGKGYSVLEVVKAFEKASGIEIPYEIVPRRSGDVPIYLADPTLAMEELGWKAEFGIEKMSEDTWRWQSKNPNGYEQ